MTNSKIAKVEVKPSKYREKDFNHPWYEESENSRWELVLYIENEYYTVWDDEDEFIEFSTYFTMYHKGKDSATKEEALEYFQKAIINLISFNTDPSTDVVHAEIDYHNCGLEHHSFSRFIDKYMHIPFLNYSLTVSNLLKAKHIFYSSNKLLFSLVEGFYNIFDSYEELQTWARSKPVLV